MQLILYATFSCSYWYRTNPVDPKTCSKNSNADLVPSEETIRGRHRVGNNGPTNIWVRWAQQIRPTQLFAVSIRAVQVLELNFKSKYLKLNYFGVKMHYLNRTLHLLVSYRWRKKSIKYSILKNNKYSPLQRWHTLGKNWKIQETMDSKYIYIEFIYNTIKHQHILVLT